MELSILDQVPISQGHTPEEALQQTLFLAEKAEEYGYFRYWVAEHHNTTGLASTAPEQVIGQIAARTNSIKVGTGGVLLPQYSPLKVAETFKTLEAFYPKRIELGVGRSPGGSQATRLALTDHVKKSLSSFPRQVEELQGFLHNSLDKDHPFRTVKAGPRTSTIPPLWILGLSERGAKNAANLGVGFVYGHFINPNNGQESLRIYRDRFKPSVTFKEPETMVCVFVVCADTDEEAEKLAISQDRWLINVGKGGNTKIPSVADAKKKGFTNDERIEVKKNRQRAIVGSQAVVKEKLIQLQKFYETDKMMIITNIHDVKAKLRSYQLIAEAFKTE